MLGLSSYTLPLVALLLAVLPGVELRLERGADAACSAESACCCAPEDVGEMEGSCCEEEEPLMTWSSACGCGGEDGSTVLHIETSPKRAPRVGSFDMGIPRGGSSERVEYAFPGCSAPSPESPPPRPLG